MARIIISLPDDLLERIDAFCKKEHYNRSEFVRYSVREKIKAIEKNAEKDS